MSISCAVALECLFISRTAWEENDNETAMSTHVTVRCKQEHSNNGLPMKKSVKNKETWGTEQATRVQEFRSVEKI